MGELDADFDDEPVVNSITHEVQSNETGSNGTGAVRNDPLGDDGTDDPDSSATSLADTSTGKPNLDTSNAFYSRRFSAFS